MSQVLYPVLILILKAFSVITSFTTLTEKVQASMISFQCNEFIVVIDIES